MKKLLLIILIGSISVTAHAVTEVNNQGQLDTYINQSKPTVVKFYANWCGPCKKLNGIYSQLESKLGGVVNFLAVNIDVAKALKKQYGATRIPFFVIFRNGKVVGSLLGPNAGQLSAWLLRQA